MLRKLKRISISELYIVCEICKAVKIDYNPRANLAHHELEPGWVEKYKF